MLFIRTALSLFLGTLGLTACGQKSPPTSSVKIDAAHSIGIDGLISDGIMLSRVDSDAIIEGEIRAQLQYLIGQLNGINSGADLNRLQLTINEKVPLADGSYEIHYSAKVLIAWRRDLALPETYGLLLPSRGNRTDLAHFFRTFKDSCIDAGEHDVSAGVFWYSYRPEKPACQNQMQGAAAELVAKIPIGLQVSTENTEGKAPEYAKIWEDGRITVTAVFGKYADGATSNMDAGVAAYNEMYAMLRRTYGKPSFQDVNLGEGVRPGVAHPAINMVFNRAEGPLDIDILLVDGILSVDQAFKERYNQRTKISDLVSYNGHSGLGANIRALARLGSFTTGQYQIFFVNGCDTFAYVDSALRDAHSAVNPGFGPSKFFDMITNAMPSYFNSNADNNLALIKAFFSQNKTYRQILAEFDRNQRALVTGEEDNAWPAAF